MTTSANTSDFSSPVPLQPKQRIVWIDFIKTFYLYFVVLEHVTCGFFLEKSIRISITPIMFFISGYLFSIKSNPEFGPFIKKRFRQIIVPFLWINVVAYLVWLFILRNFGTNVADTIDWWKPLVGITAGMPAWLIHDTPIWALVSFFVVEFLFYLLLKAGLKLWLIFSLAAVSFILLAWLALPVAAYLPLAIGPSLGGLAFYAAGFAWRRRVNKLKARGINTERPTWTSLVAFIIALFIFIPAMSENVYVTYYKCIIGNPLYFFSAAFAAITMLIVFSKTVSVIIKPNKIIQFFSVGTLLICGFHMLTLAFVKGVMLLGFGMEPAEYITGTPVSGMLVALIAYLLCAPIIWFIRKYLRFLVYK